MKRPRRMMATLLIAGVGLLLLVMVLAPRWLNTPAGRATLLGAITGLTGIPVAADGAVEFALLPRPHFTMARLRFGATGSVLAGKADRVDVELDPAGLLLGRILVSQLRVVRPELTLAEGWQSLLDLPIRLAHMPATAAEVIGGQLRLQPAHGTPLILNDLDLRLRPGQLADSRRIEGRAGLFGQSLALELEVGPARPWRPVPVSAQLLFGPDGADASLAFSGRVGAARRISGEVQLDLHTSQAVQTLARLAGGEPELALAAWRGALPASLWLRFEHTPARFAIAEARLTLGRNELHASGELLPAAPWTAHLAVHIRRVHSADLPPMAALERIRAWLSDLPFAGSIDLDAERIELFNVPVERLRARLLGDGQALWLEELRALLPAGGELYAQGQLRAREALQQPRMQLRLSLPALPEILVRAGGKERLAALLPQMLEAEMDAQRTPTGWSITRLDLLADSSRGLLTGTLTPGRQPQLKLSGEVARLSLDPWLKAVFAPDTSFAAPLAQLPFDLELELILRDLAFREARAEEGRLRLQLRERRLGILRFALKDLFGATLDVSGTLDWRKELLEVRLDGKVLTPARFARLFGLPAHPWLDTLGAVETRLELSAGRGETILALTVQAAALSGAVDLRARSLDLPGLISADLRLDVPALIPLARAARISLPDSAGAQGALALQATLTRSSPETVVTAAHGRLGAAAWTFDGEWRTSEEGAGQWRGQLRLDRLPPSLSLETLYRLLQPLTAWPAAPPWRWAGAWPTTPLLQVGTDTAAIEIESLIDAGGGRLRLFAAPGRFIIEDLQLPFADGRLGGNLALIAQDGVVQASGQLTLTDVELKQLLADGLPPPAAGRLTLALAFAGRGRSPAEIVLNLNGSGDLALRSLTVPDLQTAAAPQTIPDLASHLLLSDFDGPLQLKRGVLEAAGELTSTERKRLELLCTVDLYSWMIDVHLGARRSGSETTERIARLFGPLGAATWTLAADLRPPPDTSSIGRAEHGFRPH